LAAPRFEVVLLDGAGGPGVALQAARLMRGTLHRANGTRTVSARVVEILGQGPLQADGDVAAALPVRIAASDAFLTLMTPRRGDRA
jgi:hypothetical protein